MRSNGPPPPTPPKPRNVLWRTPSEYSNVGQLCEIPELAKANFSSNDNLQFPFSESVCELQQQSNSHNFYSNYVTTFHGANRICYHRVIPNARGHDVSDSSDLGVGVEDCPYSRTTFFSNDSSRSLLASTADQSSSSPNDSLNANHIRLLNTRWRCCAPMGRLCLCRHSSSVVPSLSLSPLKCSKIKFQSPSFLLPIVIVLLAVVIALLLLALAVIAKQQAFFNDLTNCNQSDATIPGYSPFDKLLHEDPIRQNNLSRRMMTLFNGSKIYENLRWIASEVHVAGTSEQMHLVKRLEDEYRRLGLEVTVYEYDVLLSYPDYRRANTIHVWHNTSFGWELVSDGLGQPLDTDNNDQDLRQQQTDPRAFVWWNAYARNGTVSAQIVYANYGTTEDYDLLKSEGVDLQGKITLIRYGGGIFRGDKVFLAEENGAVGVIMYGDPFDYVPEYSTSNKTFPDRVWLPPSGAQRGTLYRGSGDPLTPFMPSKPYVQRQTTEDKLRNNRKLPNVPVTSIGYKDALEIFKTLNGPAVPDSWNGSLGVLYKLTGSAVFRLNVHTVTVVRKIRNFVAFFYGREEPDKWVLLGNHADAWTKGSVDPGTGTSTMLEVARVFTSFSKQTGWRPRRTIAFCQWDAEEYGLIGSTEFVEETLRILEGRAIAYVNVDNFNGNISLAVKSVPLLYRVIVDAASRVPHPMPEEVENGRQTLLDAWRFYNAWSALPGDKSVPSIGLPSFGSDFQRFISYAGVPVADLRIEGAPQYTYAVYHTAYEVPWLNEKLMDPTQQVAIAFGRFWLEVGRQLADNLLIPFNVEDYGVILSEFFLKMSAQLRYLRLDQALGVAGFERQIRLLDNSISNFQKKAVHLQRIIQLSLRQVQMINHRLQSLERCFILDRGLFEERSEFRHAVFSISEHDLYSGVTFALILDPAVKWSIAKRVKDEKNEKHWLETVRHSFTRLQYTIESAIMTLDIKGF